LSFSKSSHSIDFNTQLNSIELMVLPKDPLIGQIKDILILGDQIYIVDGIFENIKIYDKDLKFIKEIGTKGNGPGEYMGITQAFLADNNLHIFSYWNKSVYIYQPKGEFVKQVKLQDHPVSILPIGGNYVGYMDFESDHSKKPNLILFSGNGDIIRVDQINRTMSQRIEFVGGINNNLDTQEFYYYESFSNSLQKIKPNLALSENYTFDFFENPHLGSYKNISFEVLKNTQYFMKFFNSFDSKAFFAYNDEISLKDGFIDFNDGYIYAQNQIKPDHISQFISNVRFKDKNNFYYALPHMDKIHMMKNFVDFSFPQMPDAFGEKLKAISLDEEDKFFIRFKMK